MPEIRQATATDLDAILAITNEAISNTTALWISAPFTREQRAAWMAQRQADGFPVLVATDEAGTVIGFGSYGPFRAFEGYALTVEHSVYIAPQAQGRGAGRALLEALIAAASAQGLHVMIGAITADNRASIALHERCGFVQSGTLPQVGRKFGEWLDLLLMYRILRPGTR